MVDASISDGRLTICSGDNWNEWFLYVEASDKQRLLCALRDHCGENEDTSEPVGSATLRLLSGAFSGRSGILEEIKAFFDRSGVPYTTDVWIGSQP
jgi:hypothetical protein